MARRHEQPGVHWNSGQILRYAQNDETRHYLGMRTLLFSRQRKPSDGVRLSAVVSVA